MAKSSQSSGKPLILKFDVDDKGTPKIWPFHSPARRFVKACANPVEAIVEE